VRPVEAVRPFIISEARRNPYHPIKEYLNGLVWDGGEHIDALCSHLTSSDPEVQYPGDAPLPLHQVYIYRWLIGAVAKVFEQAQNMALVLAGPQDMGKSTLASWLCSGLGEAYFLEKTIDPHDKDNDLRQMRTFIWEIAELDATTRKADMSALKAFITRKDATVRKAYGRYDTTRPTIASFIGTVNKGEGFLSDPTGNRRFLVTTITSIDHAYKNRIDVNQVWAQAVALYRSGQPWRLQVNEQQAQAAANTEHEFDSPLEGWITAHFEVAAGDSYALTSGEIIDHLRAHYDIRLSGSERAQAMEISRVCQRLGIERRRPNPARPFMYLGLRAKMPNEP
jgi:putative DNA primase/helicase